MRFGLFGSAQARRGGPDTDSSQGFREFIDNISDARRWRRVFRLMNGYSEWLQLSVFQRRLSPRRRIELKFALGEIIDHAQDHG
jgi:CRISPR associated protein Cas2